MFCVNCGKELPDGTSFCTECGKPTGKKAADEQPMSAAPKMEAPTQPKSPVAQPSAKSDTVSKSTAIIIICGVCALLAAIAIVLAVTGAFSKIGKALVGGNSETFEEEDDKQNNLQKADLYDYIDSSKDDIEEVFFDGKLGKQTTFEFDDSGKIVSMQIAGSDKYRFCGVNLKSDPNALKSKFTDAYTKGDSEENDGVIVCKYNGEKGCVEISYETETGKITQISWFAEGPETAASVPAQEEDITNVEGPAPAEEVSEKEDLKTVGYSDEELCKLASDFYEALNGQQPPYVEVDSRDGKEAVIHIFEIVNDMTVTWEWYTVDTVTGKGTNFEDSQIDLLNPPDRSFGDIDEGYYAKLDLSDPDVLIFPDADLRYIDEYELKDLTAYSCRIARNEIYARHGRVFKDKELQEYFNSKSWYYPDKNANIKLNKYETENVNTILNYEKAMGYQ